MVKHCRIDKTFQPQQCRVTLAVETLHQRFAVAKELEALQGERTQGQGPRTALARELQDWLEMKFRSESLRARKCWKVRFFWRRRERK